LTLDDLPAEARTTRLHLGEGVIPLNDILDVLPEHTPLVIETPVAAEAAWPTARRLQSVCRRRPSLLSTALGTQGNTGRMSKLIYILNGTNLNLLLWPPPPTTVDTRTRAEEVARRAREGATRVLATTMERESK
jgi:hypothetical protein